MLVAFDFDGVILDSLSLHLGIVDSVRTELGVGRAPELGDVYGTENLTFRTFGMTLGVPPESLDEFEHRVLQAVENDTSSPILFEKMTDCLTTVAEKHQVVIITSNVRHQVQRVLTPYGLNFPVFDASDPGSKGQKLKLALERFDSPADRAWMVGDAVSDIRAGKTAGVRTIAVTWGFHLEQMLLREQPDYMVRNPEELKLLLLSQE